MKELGELYSTELPSSVWMPNSIRRGLNILWKNSQETQTEWVGALVHTSDKYQVLPLGHQAPGRVIVPITNLTLTAKASHEVLNKEFVHRECVESGWDIRHIPNKDGIFYQGSILYLIPRNLESRYASLFARVLSPGDFVLAEEDFLGVAHSHFSRGSFSYLPGLQDIRTVVFELSSHLLELVVSDGIVSVLVKCKDTPHLQSNCERPIYLNEQAKIDEELKDGQTYLDALKNSCNLYRLALYSGKLESRKPLTKFFKVT